MLMLIVVAVVVAVVAIVVVAVVARHKGCLVCGSFCFGRETSKRKIRTPGAGVLIYSRTMQKENKNPSPWGSYLQGDHAKGK